MARKLWVFTCFDVDVDERGDSVPVRGTERVIASTFRASVADAMIRLLTEDSRKDRATAIRADEAARVPSALDGILNEAPVGDPEPAGETNNSTPGAEEEDDPSARILQMVGL